MEHVISIHGVGIHEVNALRNAAGDTLKDGVLTVPSPFGDVVLRLNYDMAGGTITAAVEDKPFLVSISTIESHLQKAVNDARDAVNENDGAVEPDPNNLPAATNKVTTTTATAEPIAKPATSQKKATPPTAETVPVASPKSRKAD